MQFPLKKLNIEFPHEKLCPKLYKAHAPAKAVKVLDNLKVERDGITLDKEILATKEAWWKNPPKVTVAMFKQRDFPIAIAQISTRGGELLGMTVAKYMWNKGVTVTYKGEEIIRLPAKTFAIKKWKP